MGLKLPCQLLRSHTEAKKAQVKCPPAVLIFIDSVVKVLADSVPNIIGGILAILGSLVVYFLANRSSERRHKEGLLQADRKKAIESLYQLLDTKTGTAYGWRKKITEYMHSFDAQYLPKELSSIVRQRMYDFERYADERDPIPKPEITDEELQSISEEQEALYSSLDPEDIAELEVVEYQSLLQAELKRHTESFATEGKAAKEFKKLGRLAKVKLKLRLKLKTTAQTLLRRVRGSTAKKSK